MTSNESLDTLSPAAKLALLHAQAANPSATTQQVEQDPFVPSPDDPVVVMDSYAYEPLIAGDFPTPIGKPVSSIPAPKKEPATKKKLDLNSESAFPSLSASPRAPVASGGWSSAASSRVKAPQTSSPRSRPMAPASGSPKKKSAATQVTDVLELPANQQISNMTSKPLGFKSSADVIQQVINKTGTNIIASTNRSGTTTFLIQGSPAEVARAKRELVAGLVVKVSFYGLYKKKSLGMLMYSFDSVRSRWLFLPTRVVSSLALRVLISSKSKPNLALASTFPVRKTRNSLITTRILTR